LTDIIFFNPPKQRNGEKSLFNNAMIWLASYLVRQGFKVKVFFLNGSFWPEQVKEIINKDQPKFCAISCKWWDTLYPAVNLAALIKQQNPKIKLITGGNTASSFAEELMENSVFDFVIKGDAELPLEQILQEKEPENTFIRKGAKYFFSGQSYIQTNDLLEHIFLDEHPEEFIFPASAIDKYVWTGKGCSSNCFFCAAGRNGQKKLYNRKGYIYRDIDQVINDCRIIGRFNHDQLMFDFDPMDKQKALYYEKLLQKMPVKKFSCNQFYFWYLPDKKMINLIAEVFSFAVIGIDLQVFSEPLRHRLSSERIIKPRFFANDELEAIIADISEKSNLKITLSGLLGMPFETEQDLKNTYDFFHYFMNKYPKIINIGINPIIVEPDAPLILEPEKYQVLPLRKTYHDFYELTRYTFENNLFSRPFKDYYEYLKYFGMMRKNQDESKLFNEFKKINEVLGKLISRNASLKLPS